jgi:hypothetical protein
MLRRVSRRRNARASALCPRAGTEDDSDWELFLASLKIGARSRLMARVLLLTGSGRSGALPGIARAGGTGVAIQSE